MLDALACIPSNGLCRQITGRKMLPNSREIYYLFARILKSSCYKLHFIYNSLSYFFRATS